MVNLLIPAALPNGIKSSFPSFLIYTLFHWFKPGHMNDKLRYVYKPKVSEQLLSAMASIAGNGHSMRSFRALESDYSPCFNPVNSWSWMTSLFRSSISRSNRAMRSD
jgi:hypothetical protein